MNKLKRTLAILLCLVTAFGAFSACAKKPDNEENKDANLIGNEPITVDDTDVYLVNGGKSDYKIVVSADATRIEKHAAEELKSFIEKSTAVKLPITDDKEVSHDNNAHYISVGSTKLLAAETDIKVDYEELGENGVIVKTQGNCVYVTGATENGTLFAVYRFLHYQVGYEAYAYDCVEVDYFKSLKLKNFDYKHVPSLGLTTAEDGELSGEEKVEEASRMLIYASKTGGYNLNGNLFNGLWCHTTNFLITADYDKPRVTEAQDAEYAAKLAPYIDMLISDYDYVRENDKVMPQYVKKTENGEPVLDENGKFVYETDGSGNYILATDESGKPLSNVYFMKGFDRGTATLFTSSKGSKDKVDIKSDTEGYDDYVKGWNAAYESGNYHVGSEWQKKVKSIRLWNNGQACYTKPETLELAAQTLENKYINTATGPYLMVGITDGKGSCDCEDCKAATNTYGNAAGVQMVFMNKLANKLEEYMKANGIEKQITLVAFAYYAFREPPVKLVNGEYTPVHPDVVPKNDGQVRIGIMYTPIEACYTHPITDETETCEKNATIAAEMKAWASLTTNLMMYSYGTNFQAYKYHFNNWSHIGDSIRFYEKLGLKYYFEQACAQNGISPMSSMRAYVRSKLAWNSAYDTQYLIDEFIEHYYGDGAEGVKQYFDAVMENFERIYTLAETEDQDIYYSRIMSADYWTRPLLLQLESYLEKADYAVDLGSSGDKDVYKERIFREYFLLKDNEYTMYSAYLGSDEYAALEELVMYGREKYNAYNSAEKTQNG